MSGDLFVWMGINTPEMKREALLEWGRFRDPDSTVYLDITFSACVACGRMQWVTSGKPEPFSPDKKFRDVVDEYIDRVTIEVIPPGYHDPQICSYCEAAFTRSPEVMAVVSNMIQHAVAKKE